MHVFKIGDDIVHSQHIVIGEHQPGIDYQDLPVILVHHHILSDLTQAANGDDAQFFLIFTHCLSFNKMKYTVPPCYGVVW